METSAIGVTDAKAMIAPDGRAATLKASEKEPAFVVLDFGRESVGMVQLQFLAGSRGMCELACRESLEEATQGPFQQPFEVQAKGMRRWSAPDRRAFRYLKVTAPPGSRGSMRPGWKRGYPVEDRGDFECSDPLRPDLAGQPPNAQALYAALLRGRGEAGSRAVDGRHAGGGAGQLRRVR